MKKQQHRVLLDGYYGKGNVGDEAILASLIQAVNKEHDQVNICVGSENVDHTAGLHNIDSVVPRFKLAGNKFQWLEKVFKADELIIGGGGLFSLNSYLTYGVKVALAKMLNTDVQILSIGAAEPPEQWYQLLLLRLIISQTTKVSGRDPLSIGNLYKSNVDENIDLVPDLVYGLSTPTRDHQELSKKCEGKLVVSVREPVRREINKSAIATGLDDFASRNECDILFLPFNMNRTPSDLEVCSEIASLMDTESEVYQDETTYMEMIAGLKEAKMVFGMRLHSIILSAKLRTPFLGLAYEKKCSEQLKRLHEQEILWCDEITPNEITKKLSQVWNSGELTPEQKNAVSYMEYAADSIYSPSVNESHSTTQLLTLVVWCIVVAVIDYLLLRSGKFGGS